MQVSENLIRTVVEQVLQQVRQGTPTMPATNPTTSSLQYGRYGLFLSVEDAVNAARKAFEQLRDRPIEHRRRIIEHIRRISIESSVELGTMEMQETKIGRLEHKIAKLRTLGERTPGVEFLRTECFSGDHGLAVIEHAPFGVIGAITPVTHSLPTITGNAVSMIAGGNAVVVNPHPSGKKVAAEGVRRFNEAIYSDLGIDNLISLICEPTLETAQQLFKHRSIALICVTGGPAVARAALNSGKRAVVAGPGNPPVVVDETADLEHAAKCIIEGAAFDNNLLCIAEKQVFVVASVFDAMMSAMERAGAVRLNAPEIERLTHAALQLVGEGADAHHAPRKEVLGQMMPFVPFVRCRDFDEAVACAQQSEHGYRHTSIIHSRNVRNMTRMARAMDTTLFVKNGPCMAALGLGGEGYLSFSIAGPTGEGVTTPLTFTRERRCSLIDDLFILGNPK
jgi:aldehyde dehydrogenase